MSSTRPRLRLGLAIAVVMLAAGAGHAQTSTFTGALTGVAEAPPNASPGTGSTTVTYTAATHQLTVNLAFSGLSGTTTAAHIHCCVVAPGVTIVATETPTFPGFPLGVTSGTYSQTFDLSLATSFNPAFLTANGGTPASAEAALAAGLTSSEAYLDIHTNLFPGGEIRAFLAPVAAIPTLSGLALAGLGLLLGTAAATALRRSPST